MGFIIMNSKTCEVCAVTDGTVDVWEDKFTNGPCMMCDECFANHMVTKKEGHLR